MASKGTNNFKRIADADPSKNPQLVIVDGAQGGQAATDWTNFNAPTWTTVESRLASAGVTTSQVQLLWMKQARRSPFASGLFPLHAQRLQEDEETILRVAKQRYPNLRIAYLSSRTRAYTAVSNSLNPEPFAYESCFSVRWLIEKQLAGNLNYDPPTALRLCRGCHGDRISGPMELCLARTVLHGSARISKAISHIPQQRAGCEVARQIARLFQNRSNGPRRGFFRKTIIGQLPFCTPTASVSQRNRTVDRDLCG
jgi:hypothetical protein